MAEDETQKAMERMRLATIRGRVLPIMRNTATNLREIGDKGAATRAGRPFDGATAVLCSAGPSLTHALPMLKRLGRKVAIVAVNTAAPALYEAGISIGYLLVVDNLPLGKHIDRSKVRSLVTDLAVDPAIFKQADMWFASASPHTYGIHEALGVMPLSYAGSVATAALSLCLRWGAAQVVLAGQDLAYDTEGGRAYADGSGWSGLGCRVAEEDGATWLFFDGREDRDDFHRQNQVPVSPRKRPATEVPRWGGGVTYTTLELEAQRRWMASIAERWRGHARLVNASVGGARIGGWEELHPDDVRATAVRPKKPHRVAVDPRAAMEALGEEARRSKRIEEGWIAPGAPRWELMADLVQGRTFVDGFASPDIVGLSGEDMAPPARLRGVQTVYREATRLVGEAAGEEVVCDES